jgi:non-specific protein-tyrosine kinase
MESLAASEPSVLRSYLDVVRRRAVLIALVTVVVTIVVMAFSVQATPVYQATSQVLLQPRLSEQILQNTTVNRPANQTDTEMEVMQSGSIQNAVSAALGHVPDISVSKVGETDVVDVTASSDTPAGAVRDANTYAAVYAETRRQQAIGDLTEASVELEGRVADIDSQIAALGSGDPRRNDLDTRRASYEDQRDSLQVATNLTVTGGAQVVSNAEQPSSPVSPQPLRDGAIAAGVGLVVGIALAFLFEHLNVRVRSKAELEAATDGLANVGLVPTVAGWRRHQEHEVISAEPETSSAAEAYRSLRTAVQFIGIERGNKVVQITSAVSGEGKTTTAANLGITFARAGKSVVLVDSDLRRPRLHEVFALPKEPGMMSVLLGETALEEAIVPVSDEPRLSVFPSGQVPPNPSDLLVLDSYRRLIEALGDRYDHVIIDTPPVLPVTDALIVAGVADLTFLVAAVGTSNQKDIRRAVELLRQVDAPVAGTILNMIPPHGRRGHDYFYGYGYQPSHRSRSWWRRMRKPPEPPGEPVPEESDTHAPL